MLFSCKDKQKQINAKGNFTYVRRKQKCFYSRWFFTFIFLAALWSHPKELPEFPSQAQDRNHFSFRHHCSKKKTLSIFSCFKTKIHIFFSSKYIKSWKENKLQLLEETNKCINAKILKSKSCDDRRYVRMIEEEANIEIPI